MLVLLNGLGWLDGVGMPVEHGLPHAAWLPVAMGFSDPVRSGAVADMIVEAGVETSLSPPSSSWLLGSVVVDIISLLSIQKESFKIESQIKVFDFHMNASSSLLYIAHIVQRIVYVNGITFLRVQPSWGPILNT